MVNSPLLQLTDMSLKFGDKELFLNLNMLIKEGDRAALIGCNGSGKSTLLKIISGQTSSQSAYRDRQNNQHRETNASETTPTPNLGPKRAL